MPTDAEKILDMIANEIEFLKSQRATSVQRIAVERILVFMTEITGEVSDRAHDKLEEMASKLSHGSPINNQEIEILEAAIQASIEVRGLSNLNSAASSFAPTFKVTKDEEGRILELCGEMRQIITGSDLFDKAHKTRLFKRVSAVEVEIHQPRGKLDVIIAGVSDFGEALGKFGKDVKPLVERMKEVRDITRSASREYEKLPPPDREKKALPPPEEE